METFKCSTCGEEKKRVFVKHLPNYVKMFHDENGNPFKGNKCHSCTRSRENAKWPEKKAFALKYEKTINGFLMRTYRNMESRVSGVQKLKAHLYEGLELLERSQFYEWSKSNNDFNALYETWEKSKYERKLTPSIDRIDVKKGDVLNNMRWITHSENSRLGAISKVRKKNEKIMGCFRT